MATYTGSVGCISNSMKRSGIPTIHNSANLEKGKTHGKLMQDSELLTHGMLQTESVNDLQIRKALI